jgi:tRNA(Ile)-lysidine synthase
MPSVAKRYAEPEGAYERPSGQLGSHGRAPVVLMVSGGADSCALLVRAAVSRLDIDDGRGLARIARERLHVLHVNHRLRGMDAEEDEEFVREMAARYGIPCDVERVDVAALASDGPDSNVENVAREVRYAAANELANRLSAEFGTPRSAARILTAHTADDRAETFLMNAIKGTGPAGLASIPRRRNRIVRPLLDETHDSLCDYLRMHGIVWREDVTNADTRYLRAFVRHELLPLARTRNPRIVESLSNTCDILSDEDAYLTQIATKAARDLERRRAEGLVALDGARLAALEVAVARRVVRREVLSVCPGCRLEARHVSAILSLVAAGEGSVTIPMGAEARVAYGLLFVRARTAGPESFSGWLEVPGETPVPGGRRLVARLREVPAGQDASAAARDLAARMGADGALADAARVGLSPEGGRLWVDAPEAGDVLCPFGMHGQSKKLSDLLHDEGVPASDRPLVPVVRSSPTGRVVWVAGIRLDERARCTASTKVALELCLRPGSPVR